MCGSFRKMHMDVVFYLSKRMFFHSLVITPRAEGGQPFVQIVQFLGHLEHVMKGYVKLLSLLGAVLCAAYIAHVIIEGRDRAL